MGFKLRCVYQVKGRNTRFRYQYGVKRGTFYKEIPIHERKLENTTSPSLLPRFHISLFPSPASTSASPSPLSLSYSPFRLPTAIPSLSPNPQPPTPSSPYSQTLPRPFCSPSPLSTPPPTTHTQPLPPSPPSYSLAQSFPLGYIRRYYIRVLMGL